MSYDRADSVSSLIHKFANGDREAAGRLVETLYPEIKRLAVARMRHEGAEHTWQPSALVNELYLELLKVQQLRLAGEQANQERALFFGVASQIMSRLLIERARRLYKRVTKTSLEACAETLPAPESRHDVLCQIDDLLMRLDAINPRLRRVVELRVFEGLSGDEIAARLGCTRRTVVRDWSFARQFIERQLQTGLR